MSTCRYAGWLGASAALLVITGCATWHAPADTSDTALRARAITRMNRDVQLSAAILGRKDAIRMFGVDLEAAGVQPVWIEVRNDTPQELWLVRSGTDPDYFSPLEVAWGAHIKLGGGLNARIDEHFDRLAFRSPIPAGEVRSGILFTNPQPLIKLLNVDLLGNKLMIPFTLFLPTPEETGGSHQFQVHAYAEDELTRCEDLQSLRRAIEALPCCTSSTQGSDAGEPVNIVVVGNLDDIGAAMIRRGYLGMADTGTGHTLFGRAPDLLVRKYSRADASASWLRAWRAPINYGEQAVFVLQGGRPVGGRFAEPGEQRLHPDVDEVRNTLIHDLLYSGGIAKFGFATGVGEVQEAQPRELSDGTYYYTDGLRAVLLFGPRPLTFDDVELLDWALPPGAGTEAAEDASR